MAKIFADKYLTSPRTAKFCIDKVYEVIGRENISEIIEPSAGCGSFSKQIPECKAFDLYPQHPSIKQADFTTLDLGGYKPKRLFIGNPPFGGGSGKLIKQFYDKCTTDGDYIAFILPIGFYNNYKVFNKFEIIYQTAITIEFSNVIVKSAFIIYKRNKDKDKYENDDKIDAIQYIIHGRSNKKDYKYKTNTQCDYYVGQLGSVTLKEVEPYSHVSALGMKIKEDWREEVIVFMKWLFYYNLQTNILTQFCVSVPGLNKSRLNQLIKICIKGIE